MNDQVKSPSEMMAERIAEANSRLLAACHETEGSVGGVIDKGLRSVVHKINESFDAEIEKLKGTRL